MGNIEKREITIELRESYLDYAMSVIVARALPDVRDGLKPVQRRILWAMWETGLKASAKLRKSAAVVGEVMKSYHPHGDSALYDALARMVQNFSLRYPLVKGQGNWGSIDGDNQAAMRYTECRLAKIAESLLEDIEKETVDWSPNYDTSTQEPKVLPAKLPNLLLNGAVGIAVGMATSIPPHNLREVSDAILELIDNPSATAADLMEKLKGPDFPTGGIIYDRKAIVEAYTNGRGSIAVRGVAEVQERSGGKGGYDIVITEIPYQVNKAEFVIEVANLVQNKKLIGVRDIRDESGREGLRVVIELKSDAAPQKILNQLYRRTNLQRDFHLNMIALVEVTDPRDPSGSTKGLQPQVLSIKDVLAAYIVHREVVVRRRTTFDLRRAEERAHILEGLVKALSTIDRVIETIKRSANRDEAHKNLIQRFKLTDVQANAILEMRLQSLAALERQKIEEELKEKRALINRLIALLKSQKQIRNVVKDELCTLTKTYGDARRTKVMATGLKNFREEDLIPEEEAIITFSKSGYIKRLSPGTFRSQRRGGKGLIGSGVADEDFLTHLISARTHDNIFFFTNRGRVFQTKVWEIPAASRTSKGKPIQNFLEIPAAETVTAIVTHTTKPNPSARRYLAMLTERGIIKKTPLEEFNNVRRTGIIAIKLSKGDALRWVELSTVKDEIIITTKHGKAIRFKEAQVRSMGRTASGVRAIQLEKNDVVSSMDIIGEAARAFKKTKLLVVTMNGYGKQTPLTAYRLQRRGGSGIKTSSITTKTGALIAAHLISNEEEIIAISAKGQIIRTKISDVRTAGRATQGVKIMTLKSNDALAGVVCL